MAFAISHLTLYNKMAIVFEKGLKIKDYQNMINARDENLESKRRKIKEQFRMGLFYGYMLGSFLMFLFMLFILTKN